MTHSALFTHRFCSLECVEISWNNASCFFHLLELTLSCVIQSWESFFFLPSVAHLCVIFLCSWLRNPIDSTTQLLSIICEVRRYLKEWVSDLHLRRFSKDGRQGIVYWDVKSLESFSSLGHFCTQFHCGKTTTATSYWQTQAWSSVRAPMAHSLTIPVVGSLVLSSLCIALAAYQSLYPIMLVVPAALHLAQVIWSCLFLCVCGIFCTEC